MKHRYRTIQLAILLLFVLPCGCSNIVRETTADPETRSGLVSDPSNKVADTGSTPISVLSSKPVGDTHRITKIWRELAPNAPFNFSKLRQALELFSAEDLRSATYTTADQFGETFVVDGILFDVPSNRRAWAESLVAELAKLSPNDQAAILLKLDALYAGIMESWPTLQASWRQHDNALDGTTMREELDSGPVEFFAGVPWVYQEAAVWRMWINSELVKLVEDAPVAKAYKPAERQALLSRIAKSSEFYREDPIP